MVSQAGKTGHAETMACLAKSYDLEALFPGARPLRLTVLTAVTASAAAIHAGGRPRRLP